MFYLDRLAFFIQLKIVRHLTGRLRRQLVEQPRKPAGQHDTGHDWFFAAVKAVGQNFQLLRGNHVPNIILGPDPPHRPAVGLDGSVIPVPNVILHETAVMVFALDHKTVLLTVPPALFGVLHDNVRVRRA